MQSVHVGTLFLDERRTTHDERHTMQGCWLLVCASHASHGVLVQGAVITLAGVTLSGVTSEKAFKEWVCYEIISVNFLYNTALD